MTDMVVLILGAVTGGVVAWFWSSTRCRAETAFIVADLRATIGAHEGTITELRNQVANRKRSEARPGVPNSPYMTLQGRRRPFLFR